MDYALIQDHWTLLQIFKLTNIKSDLVSTFNSLLKKKFICVLFSNIGYSYITSYNISQIIDSFSRTLLLATLEFKASVV